MHVILLERIASLGQMGDEVRVRDGYARNYLLPQGKALRANDANRKRFESQRVQLETRNLERRTEASAIAEKLDGQSFVLVRQAAETGQLYGSVTPRDLADAITEAGFSVSRSQVALGQPIKSIGLHKVSIALHPDVTATIVANVARSPDEAERQARGEDLTAPETEVVQEVEVEVATEFFEEAPAEEQAVEEDKA
jgi:large subunit ribosomal protein L9